MRTMSRESVLALFWVKRSELGNTEAAVMAVYEAGRAAKVEALQKKAWREKVARSVEKKASPTLKQVAHRRGVSVALLTGKDQYPALCRIREEACWLLWGGGPKNGGLSYSEVGVALNRDHSSVMSSCRKFEKRLANEPGLRSEIGLPASPPALEIVKGAA